MHLHRVLHPTNDQEKITKHLQIEQIILEIYFQEEIESLKLNQYVHSSTHTPNSFEIMLIIQVNNKPKTTDTIMVLIGTIKKYQGPPATITRGTIQ